MVRIIALVLVATLGLAGCVQTENGGPNRIDPRDAHAIRLNQMDLVNTIRAAQGLQPVTLSPQLTAAAQTHARDMAAQLRAWNFGSDRSSPQTRAERAGFVGLITGENVAETFLGPVEMFQFWYADPRAKAAMLHPDATHMSLGWYQEESGKLWWVQLIGAQQNMTPVVMAESQ
ncbi:MAG: CAP domain-containing protein [Rhodobacteraceae bacterium]|nr:CAP domain-containing protein [Paracoccaceae bacterium]